MNLSIDEDSMVDIGLQRPALNAQIEELLDAFRGRNGAKRQKARHELVRLGHHIIPHLRKHLDDKQNQVRWEIAKTLEELQHPSAAPAMVKLLMDDVPGIRWLAGEGLIHLKRGALVPLLRGLQKDFHSTFFREGAHHVLRNLEQEGLLNDQSLELLKALEGPAPGVSVPFAAAEALRSLADRQPPFFGPTRNSTTPKRRV